MISMASVTHGSLVDISANHQIPDDPDNPSAGSGFLLSFTEMRVVH
jgi:hypothetical protein